MSSRQYGLGLLTALALSLGAMPATGQDTPPRRPFLAYHESWFERPATGPFATTLVMVPAYVSIVALSFVKPDLTYSGGLDLSDTGLSYQFHGQVLKDAIAQLKRGRPGIKVVLAVGGWNNNDGWARYDPGALARLVADLGADGVDLDYESHDAGCAPDATGRIACATDAIWRDVVARTRAALPRPYLLTLPGWGNGAFGEGKWRDTPPGGGYRGVMLDLLRSPLAREIDLVTIMAYDTGPVFDPAAAYRAYREVWPGPLALGVQVPPSFQGGPEWNLEMVAREFEAVTREDPQAGAMLYGLLGRAPADGTPGQPDGRDLAQALCRALGQTGCEIRLP